MKEQVETPLQLLQEELFRRQEKNAAYSLRSFARDLGISPSYLSLLFSGRRGLPLKLALRIVRKMNWPRARQKYFLALVEFDSVKSDRDKQKVLAEVQKWARLSHKTPSLAIDQFAMIAEWKHSAILAILGLPHFTATRENIAQRLGISVTETDAALARLQRLELVDRNSKGAWGATHANLAVHAIPSEAIRNYHKETLRKAMVAIDQQNFEDRDFSNFIFTVDKEMLPEAKKRLVGVQQEFSQLLEGKKPTQIYQLSIQLFRVDKPAL